MTDDIERHLIESYYLVMHCPTEIELQDLLLQQLEQIFGKNGMNIHNYNLPEISVTYKTDRSNQLTEDELNYDAKNLEEANGLYAQLNNEQREAFHKIVNSNTIVSYLRAHKKIVLTVASSGVASLLLPNGRTAHSWFRIPIEIDEISMCDIKNGEQKLLSQTDLIIWDEALMTNRQCFEALDRSLRDILCENNTELCDDFILLWTEGVPFGGKVVVLGGDPKQILPVIENANKAQIINASIFRSYLWNHVNKIYLNQNMRLKRVQPGTSEYKEINDFNDWILMRTSLLCILLTLLQW
ncbi:LOW QUALITY PROTEIN: hypothetical protein U9M48_018664 [Paspalum notatum var. saurae]|uniref:ATP-dependent DNA helicase n=1 Tax=Paspalum notatum var. saurae TaxID=547442 RepID=A0AAQ3WQR2_PASNO